MTNSILDIWKNFILEKKWKENLFHEQIFKNIDKIYNTISNFFPKQDFYLSSPNKNNWIVHILESNNISSIYQLDEITELITYYNQLSQKERDAFRLIKKNNSINYKELRNILFEISVNYHLDKLNLNPSYTDSYIDDKGEVRPLDSSFIFNDKKYIVECNKLYSKKFEIFWNFAARIIEKFKVIGEKQTVFTDEMVSGYIGIKVDKNLEKILNKAEQEFNKRFKEYFKVFKDKNNVIIKGFEPIENKEYVICIEPDFLEKYENEYPKSLAQFDYYIKFQTRAKDIIHGLANAKVYVKVTHKKTSKFVSEKIRDKINQHKSSNFHKLIFIEIEDCNLPHKDGYSIPLTKENLDKNQFDKLIDDKTSIVFILKTITNLKQEYNVGFLKNSQFDPELMKKLENIMIN